MSSFIKSFLTIIIIFITTLGANAQVLEDVVYLENGSIIKGKVLEYEKGGNIKIEIYGGSILVYKSSEVVKITKEENKYEHTKSKKKHPTHMPSNTGKYVSFTGETMLGFDYWGSLIPGIGFSATAGWHFHRLLGIGGGIGMMTVGEGGFVPIYANIRSNFMKTSASIFGDLNIGYGVAIPTFFRENKGGLYLRPAIGVRFASKRKTHVTLDFGYLIQFAQNQYFDWNGRTVTEKRTFYRPSIRVGVIF